MLPNPLHPAIVHFPVVLACLLPFFVAGAMWAIRRGARLQIAWGIPVAVALALAASTWAAVETGEQQEERVERVVGERALSAHEEMAEVFLTSSAVLALIGVVGLVGGVAGRTARVLTAAGSVALAAGAFRVGHTGGQLVYRYGAASAYSTDSGRAPITNRTAGSAAGVVAPR
jgi:uncharacterized membrane protein